MLFLEKEISCKMKKENIFLIIGACLSAITVMIGAFGAHALHNLLTENNRLDTFKTAVEYQLFHAMGILLIGIIYKTTKHQLIKWAGFLFMIGILFFSGSLYILSISNQKIWGAVAPIGGLSFIMGWLLLAIGIYKN